ncbi:MAG: hypothetical protein ACOH2M_01300 [Cypionkella sp.]
MSQSRIQKLDQHRVKINGLIARFEAAGCQYIRTLWKNGALIVEGSVLPFPPEPGPHVAGLPHYAAPAFGANAAMRDCVDCSRTFYSRSSANVVCPICKGASTSEFEGGI